MVNKVIDEYLSAKNTLNKQETNRPTNLICFILVIFMYSFYSIAFYQKSRLQHTNYWTGHMTKISLVERKKMHDLLNDNKFYDLLKNKINNS